MQEHYERLGLKSTATIDEIKARYNRLKTQNTDAAELKKLGAAYNAIMNERAPSLSLMQRVSNFFSTQRPDDSPRGIQDSATQSASSGFWGRVIGFIRGIFAQNSPKSDTLKTISTPETIVPQSTSRTEQQPPSSSDSKTSGVLRGRRSDVKIKEIDASYVDTETSDVTNTNAKTSSRYASNASGGSAAPLRVRNTPSQQTLEKAKPAAQMTAAGSPKVEGPSNTSLPPTNNNTQPVAETNPLADSSQTRSTPETVVPPPSSSDSQRNDENLGVLKEPSSRDASNAGGERAAQPESPNEYLEKAKQTMDELTREADKSLKSSAQFKRSIHSLLKQDPLRLSGYNGRYEVAQKDLANAEEELRSLQHRYASAVDRATPRHTSEVYLKSTLFDQSVEVLRKFNSAEYRFKQIDGELKTEVAQLPMEAGRPGVEEPLNTPLPSEDKNRKTPLTAAADQWAEKAMAEFESKAAHCWRSIGQLQNSIDSSMKKDQRNHKKYQDQYRDAEGDLALAQGDLQSLRERFAVAQATPGNFSYYLQVKIFADIDKVMRKLKLAEDKFKIIDGELKTEVAQPPMEAGRPGVDDPLNTVLPSTDNNTQPAAETHKLLHAQPDTEENADPGTIVVPAPTSEAGNNEECSKLAATQAHQQPSNSQTPGTAVTHDYKRQLPVPPINNNEPTSPSSNSEKNEQSVPGNDNSARY